MADVTEIRHFIDILQSQYAEALKTTDEEGMYETSYALTRSYAAIGNITLAGRWAYECEKRTKDPSKIFAINMLLLCGILKKKHLNKKL